MAIDVTTLALAKAYTDKVSKELNDVFMDILIQMELAPVIIDGDGAVLIDSDGVILLNM